VSTAAAATAATAYPRVGLFIDGEWIVDDRERAREVRNPATGAFVTDVPKATDEDLARALAAAERGFAVWSQVAPEERAELLRRVCSLMDERIEAIASVITLEQGKTINEARGEVRRAITYLMWDAGRAEKLQHEIVPSEHLDARVLQLPIGPVAAFTPWNVPLSATARKFGGSIAAGCSIVVKAAEETPATACLFVQCFADAGLPAGVMNLVFGDPAAISKTLVESPVIRMVTLTGSTAVGKIVASLAGANLKPVVAELGGSAPVVIGSQVDVPALARAAARAKAFIAGQACVSPTRFVVLRERYEEFVDAMATEMSRLRVGDGFDEQVDMGPLLDGRRVATVQGLVDDAVGAGARLVTGGAALEGPGHFYAPTVLADVPLDARVMNEEPFAPVALCVPAESLEEAIDIANALPFGLMAYAFSDDTAEIEAFGRIESGGLSINHFGMCGPETPFGGVKESGLGREGGANSLLPFSTFKTTTISRTPL
jgi:succinate-semialdehyde dehydrogenase / glutarate-semialdehyde dehydrogenase